MMPISPQAGHPTSEMFAPNIQIAGHIPLYQDRQTLQIIGDLKASFTGLFLIQFKFQLAIRIHKIDHSPRLPVSVFRRHDQNTFPSGLPGNF
jgi:hypothetical protein